MKHAYIRFSLLVLLAPPAAIAQEGSASLSRAVLVLESTDLDKDGRVSAREAGTIPVAAEEFGSLDQDKDGFWSRDEFLLFYRRKLIAAGQTVGADLEAETTRVHALRRARLEAETRQTSTADPLSSRRLSSPAPAGLSASRATLLGAAGPSQRLVARRGAGVAQEPGTEARLISALDELEQRASTGRASPADFERTRKALELLQAPSSRGAPVDPVGNATYRKMLQSLERLEKGATEGKFSREQYQELRESIVRRAREIDGEPEATPARTPLVPGSNDILTRLENALEHLEQRAVAAGASREDFVQVRAEWTALARSASQGSAAAPVRVADPASETYRKLLQSLDRLEARAREGAYSRDDYRELREQMTQRARAIATAAPAPSVSRTPPIARAEARVPSSAPITAPTPSDADLQRSLDDLEQRAASGRAGREDFQRVRDQLTARARAGLQHDATAEARPATDDLYQKLLSALDRLEQRATEGVYSREEYAELRAAFVQRARRAQAGSTPTPSAAGPERASAPQNPKQRDRDVAGSEAAPTPQPVSRPNAGERPRPQPETPIPTPEGGRPRR